MSLQQQKRIFRTPIFIVILSVGIFTLMFFVLKTTLFHPSQNIQLSESDSQTATYQDVIHINNCGNNAETQQTALHSFSVSIEGLVDNNSEYSLVKNYISENYSQYSQTVKSITIIAPPNSNMEYVLKWTENKRTGIVRFNNINGYYNIQIPISVELISSMDLGCGKPINLTPTTSPTANQVELAILNVTSEAQPDGSLKKTAELSISPLGLGTFEVSYPSTMKLGESSTISLTITPNSALTDLPKVYITPSVNPTSTKSDFVLNFNDQIEIYPVMSVELKGINFNIISDEHPEKPVISTSSSEWIWNVTPVSSGKQSLVIFISVPVIIDKAHDLISAQTLRNMPIDITVEAPETPAPTEISTATPLPPLQRIGEKMIDESPIVLGAFFTLVVGLITAYVTFITNRKKDIENSKVEKTDKPKSPKTTERKR